jgi:hypothetical protein
VEAAAVAVVPMTGLARLVPWEEGEAGLR